MIYIKKSISILLCAVIVSVFRFSAFAGCEYSWFFKRAENGTQPICFGGSDMPKKYGALYMGNGESKKVYLTFDAGYGNENLEKAVEILKKQNVKAAFFILPEIINCHLPLLNDIINDGHIVCNHSFSHKNISNYSKEELKTELECLETLYESATGKKLSKYFRPPEGRFSENTLKYCSELGYTPVFWSFAYEDWDNGNQKSDEYAYNKIMSSLHNGMVLLLHPNSSTNSAILESVITDIKSKGYEFSTLDELFFEEKTNFCATDISRYKENGMILSENPSAGKKLALTFDDGPDKYLTDEILDILAEYDVKATFFVIGENAYNNPSPLRRAIAENHEIGNHTYSHILYKNSDLDEYIEDVNKNEEFLYCNFGVNARLFRPPGGYYESELVEKINSIGYKYVLWAWRMDTKDWTGNSAEEIVNTVKNGVKGGDIILFHDFNSHTSHTPEALRVLIPYLREQGYEFVTVSELFSD